MTAIRPLFAAGFVTAFGAHSIAANLASGLCDLAHHLLTLGVLLALGLVAAASTAGRRRRPESWNPDEGGVAGDGPTHDQ